jgi:hypothetical protein
MTHTTSLAAKDAGKGYEPRSLLRVQKELPDAAASCVDFVSERSAAG